MRASNKLGGQYCPPLPGLIGLTGNIYETAGITSTESKNLNKVMETERRKDKRQKQICIDTYKWTVKTKRQEKKDADRKTESERLREGAGKIENEIQRQREIGQ